MKLVRKFIRLFPIIYLLVIFLIMIVNKDIWIENNLSVDQKISIIMTKMNLESGAWDTIIESNFYVLMGPFSGIHDWFYNNIAQANYIIMIPISICCYELWCSLIFLLFDVFGFIFNVAETWLRKGDKLNE